MLTFLLFALAFAFLPTAVARYRALVAEAAIVRATAWARTDGSVFSVAELSERAA
jgi:cytochrome P450